MSKVGINGFGRIGRSTLRAILENPDLNIDVAGINDLTEPEHLAYLFKYDSVKSEFPGDVSSTPHSLIINGREIHIMAESDPSRIPWDKLGIDVVLECTGRFTQGSKARAHMEGGAKKVIISAPAKEEDITINIGVNEHLYDPEKHHVISNASCTTNCLSPMAKIIHENFGIRSGFMTTVHSYTASQKLVDAPDPKDKRRGRAAAVNIVPTSTGAASSIHKLIPELNGKMDGYALRVPSPDVSILDLTVFTEKPVTLDELKQIFKDAAHNGMQKIMLYSEAPLVSSDFQGNSHSCIIDADLHEGD